jgi:hypothetical protein
MELAMSYLLWLYIMGCLATGHLMAHGHVTVWYIIPVTVFGIIAMQIGYFITAWMEQLGGSS